MANDYFQFKKFKIEQANCAMKVCTDACIFGAFTTINTNTKTILDIGTGTGLLSLMLAQKNKNTNISSIEIDKNAFLQAQNNFENSIYKNQILPILGDVKTYNFNQKFDFIICNPPFYENDLKSKNTAEQIAKHTTKLSFEELFFSIEKNLHINGKFAILLPYFNFNIFEKLANQNNFFAEKYLLIKHSNRHNYFRKIGIFSKNKIDKIPQEILIIKTNENNYTIDFKNLLKDFYLDF